MQITYKVKNLFFNRAEVIRQVGKINAKALSKAGAFIRRRSRSSLRRRKAASPPGSPPSVHSTSPIVTLKNILFAYDPRNQSVVIGPVHLPRAGGQAPALQEFGGTTRGRKRIRTIGKGRNKRALRGPVQTVHLPARPFMGPALKAETPNIPTLWASHAGGKA